MHLKAFSGWLFLAPVLGSALAGHAEQEVLAGWDSTLETTEQVPIERPHFPPHRGPAESTGTIYQALANDTRYGFALGSFACDSCFFESTGLL